MKLLEAILVEDEPQNRKLFEQLLTSYCPSVKLIAQCGTFEEAKKILTSTPSDLLFLDVELDVGNSIELLDQVDIGKTQIIFITAHKEYAMKVFKHNTTDYLLKPLDIEELIAAVHRAHHRHKNQEYMQREELDKLREKQQQNHFDFVSIANMDKVNFVKLKEVLYCKSSGRYTEFHLIDKKVLVASKPLGEYEKYLVKKQFFRIHNSYLVNLEFLSGITRKGGTYCELSNGDFIPISRRRLPILTQRLEN